MFRLVITEGLRMQDQAQTGGQRGEFFGFLFLTVVLAPIISIAVVGGYGFLTWMYQVFVGPPTI